MPDYKTMYFKLMAATEDAISLLISAQRECEELYINAPEQESDPMEMQSAEEE